MILTSPSFGMLKIQFWFVSIAVMVITTGLIVQPTSAHSRNKARVGISFSFGNFGFSHWNHRHHYPFYYPIWSSVTWPYFYNYRYRTYRNSTDAIAKNYVYIEKPKTSSLKQYRIKNKSKVVTKRYPRGYWYYCDSSKQFYPKITTCSTPWKKVLPE